MTKTKGITKSMRHPFANVSNISNVTRKADTKSNNYDLILITIDDSNGCVASKKMKRDFNTADGSDLEDEFNSNSAGNAIAKCDEMMMTLASSWVRKSQIHPMKKMLSKTMERP